MTTELSRRLTWPDDKHSRDSWSIYYGDVGVGSISKHQGTQREFWQWSVGFYPGRHPADHKGGTAETFERAREAWGKAWAEYLPTCTEEQFEEWRRNREWTEDKYALWDAGFRNLTVPLRCTCGESFDADEREARRLHIPHLARRNR